MTNIYTCRAPKNSAEFEAYYQLRWDVLRRPMGQPKESEKDKLESQSHHRIVIDEFDNILGVGRLHKTSQDIAQIRYMAIATTSQGKGLATKLMDELESLAKQLGVTKIELNARESAVDFYTKQGYENNGFSHMLYDVLYHDKMSKRLASHRNHLVKKAMALQQVWHETIPLSKAMNISICYFDQHQLITNCEPVFNKNLHNTMFAGSIYTLATLTGWGWIYFLLQQRELHADIVLAEGNIRYFAPLAGVAHAKTSQALVRELDQPAEKNPRFNLEVEICCGDKTVAKFIGVYAAILKTL